MTRLYLGIAGAVVLAGLLWGAVHIWNKAQERDAAVAELASATAKFKADVAALQAARDHELKIAKEASDGYQTDLARLERERDNVPIVRVCKPANKPVPAESRAPSGPGPAGKGHLGEPVTEDSGEGPDIGPDLLEYGIACEANALQLDRLIQWVNSR